MDPTLAAKAIEGYENVLQPESAALDAFYRQFRCPRCQNYCHKETVRGHVFSDANTLSPRSCLRCNVCDCLFDPHSGLLLERGDQARARDAK